MATIKEVPIAAGPISAAWAMELGYDTLLEAIDAACNMPGGHIHEIGMPVRYYIDQD